jgi:hypothetical protein
MLVSEIKLNETSSQQMIECTVCETQISQYMIDCYPCAMRGLVWAILLSTVFWGSVIGVLMLVF